MSTASTPGRLGYRAQLDGLRGFCVIWVFAYHALFWPTGAAVALSTFFVQSGFLITMILLEEKDFKGTIRLGTFYKRRALRILPAVYVFLAVYAGVALVLGGIKQGIRLGAAGAGFTYVTNWVLAYGKRYPIAEAGHLWSLSVEEQFYLLWPISLVIALALGWRRHAPKLLIGGIIAIFLWRFQLGFRGATGGRLFFGSDVRFDELFIGCWLAFAFREGWLTSDKGRRVVRFLLPPATLMWFGLLFFTPHDIILGAETFKYLGGLTLGALSAAVLIAWLAISDTSRMARFCSTQAFIVLGVASYSIYLWHEPIIVWTRYYGPDFVKAAPLLFSIPLTALFGTASHLLVERPFLRLKDRFSLVKHTAASESAALPNPDRPPV